MKPLYHLDSFQFSFAKKLVLNIEQLEIPTNNITALLGSNGAGKSTLLKALAFLEYPQQGVIHFCGQNTKEISPLLLRRQVVLVAQSPYLLRGTVIENVLLGLKFRNTSKKFAKKQAFEALEKVGLDTFENRNISELSGGEAQKVAMARALALEPKVLLLDEPFSHLDQLSIEQLSQLIADFSNENDRSVIFSSHDKAHAALITDNFIHLVNGVSVSVT